MATTFTINGQNIQANIRLASVGRVIPAGISNARITLTDTANQWGSVRSNTNFVICWGVQIDRNNGQGWKWFLFQGDPTTTPEGAGDYSGPTGQDVWIPFGSRGKNGGMPALEMGKSDLIANTADNVRLAILTNSNITLGAVITVS